MAINAEKFPETIPHLAKHAEVVRDLASLQNNNAWSVYNQQVRMDRQVRNMPWSTFIMEFYIMATRARDNDNFGGHYQGQRPFRQPSDLPFVGVGKIVEEWDDQSGGRTPLNLQEGIAGVSRGMAFAERQTAS